MHVWISIVKAIYLVFPSHVLLKMPYLSFSIKAIKLVRALNYTLALWCLKRSSKSPQMYSDTVIVFIKSAHIQWKKSTKRPQQDAWHCGDSLGSLASFMRGNYSQASNADVMFKMPIVYANSNAVLFVITVRQKHVCNNFSTNVNQANIKHQNNVLFVK